MISRDPFRVILAVALITLVAPAASCAPREATIVVRPDEVHQTMRGWEVTTDMTAERPEPVELYREQLYDMAVNEVGIDRVRLEVRSGAENTDHNWTRLEKGEISGQEWRPLRYATVNDNDDPRTINWAGFDFAELNDTVEKIVLPLQRRLAARGEKLFVNLCYVAFANQITTGNYIHDNPEEYAEFVLAVYLHLKQKYGLVPDYFEALLEPDNVSKWNPHLMGEAIVAASRRLRENGFAPAFIAPSTTDMARTMPWIDEIAGVDGALDDIAEISYHRYRNSTRANAAQIADRAARYGKPSSMLEWWFGNATHRVLYEDLTVANAAAWQGQVLRTLFKVDLADPKKPIVRIADDTRLNRQYFKYVRIGAQRIGAHTTGSGGVRPAAFINKDGHYVVVVSTDGATDLSISGLQPGRYRVSYELENGGGASLPEPVIATAQTALKTHIPASGVITVFAEPGGP